MMMGKNVKRQYLVIFNLKGVEFFFNQATLTLSIVAKKTLLTEIIYCFFKTKSLIIIFSFLQSSILGPKGIFLVKKSDL